MSKQFGEWLNKRRREMTRAEGRPAEDPITWRRLALRAGVSETSILRWSKGVGKPRRFDDVLRLAGVFGYEVFPVLGYPEMMPPDLDPALKYLFDHRNNPEVREIILDGYIKARGMLG